MSQQRNMVLLAASWLEGGRIVHQLVLILLLADVAALGWGPPDAGFRVLVLGALLAGALESFYAWRVRLDQRIFKDWTRTWSIPGGERPEETLITFDLALQGFGVTSRPQRSLEDRVKGALRLFKYQVLLFGLMGMLSLVAWITGDVYGI